MKKLNVFFLVLIMSFSVNSIFAQFGNNMNGGGYGNQGGMGGSRMGQMNHNIPQNDKPEEESDKSKKERLDKAVLKLKTDLTLDELQVYAVKAVVEDSMKKQTALFKKEGSEIEKLEEFQALSESTDRKILEFLNKEQKAKYIEQNSTKKEKIQELLDRRR